MFVFPFETHVIVITALTAFISLAISEFDTNACILIGIATGVLGLIVLMSALFISLASQDIARVLVSGGLTMVIVGMVTTIVGMGFDIHRMDVGEH